jgi:hypothetical protein
MNRISSNFTLGLRIFVPTVWCVFFGAFTIAFLISSGDAPLLNSWTFRISWTLGFLFVLLLIRQSIWKLRRVEVDNAFIYVTDYFKTARYPFHNIETIRSISFGLFWLGVIHYKQAGIFGKISYFIQKRTPFLEVMPMIEDLKDKVVEKE